MIYVEVRKRCSYQITNVSSEGIPDGKETGEK